MSDYVKQLKQKIQYNGWIRIIHDGLVMIGIKITPYYLVEEGGGPAQPEFERERYPGYTIENLGRDDMKLIAEVETRTLTEEQLKERLNTGCKCLAVKKDGKVLAFTWFNLKACSYPGHRFELKQDEAYLQDAYVLMPYRGLRLAPFIRYESYKELKKIGRTRLYSVSELVNNQSIRFKRKLNARFVYLGLFIRLFNTWSVSIPLKRSCA